MTDRESMTENRDCGADAAAYVLGALERDEADAFRAHMATCVVCRDEVSAFQEVADALPLAAPPHKVPRGLKRRVMADVRAQPRGARQRRPWFSFLTSMPTPGLALGALAAIMIIAVGAVALITSGGTSTHVYAAIVTWKGSAQVKVTGSRGELVVNRMPAPPAGKVYEVWLLKRGASAPSPTSALFSVTSSGSGSVDVPGNLHDVGAVLVTPEPVGGSRAPTHTPVLQARLT